MASSDELITAAKSWAGTPVFVGKILKIFAWAMTRYVAASGTSLGSRGDEQERIRTGLDTVTARNPNIKISAKVASSHGAILKKDFPAIAEAVREVAALDGGRR